jgi:hypothetical protein
LHDNPTTIQLVVSNRIGETNQQLVISEQVATKKLLEKIPKRY